MASNSIKYPPLPPGFELESSTSTNQNLPPLPPGFELESQNQLRESPGKGLFRAAVQPFLGAAEFTGPGFAGMATAAAGTGEALAELEDLKERLPRLKKLFPQLNWPEEIDENEYMQAVETASKYAPYTVAGLGEAVESATGLPTGEPKTRGQELLRLAGGSKAIGGKGVKATVRAASTPVVAETFKAMGVPEGAADQMALIATQAKLPKSQKPIKETKKLPTEAKPEIFEETEIVRHPSGLTKLKIEEGKPGLAIISPERQKRTIAKLNQEAAALAKKTIEKHLPIVKEIEKGKDIEKSFNKWFSSIEKLAEKYNPQVDIKPVIEFLGKKSKEFRGLVDLTSEQKKILKSIRSHYTKAPNQLKNVIKNIRNINKLRTEIYETARIKGQQRELEKYLGELKRSYEKAMFDTFPSDSPFVKAYKTSNAMYSQYQNALKAQDQLRSLLHASPTPANIMRLAYDRKAQKRLKISLGEEGAKEIVQLAKDLESARKSLARIPNSVKHEMDIIWPLKYLGLPIYAAKKGLDIFRKFGGVYLTSPSVRRVYRDALKAAEKGNIGAYKEATKLLQQETATAIKEEPKLLTHQPKLLEYKAKSKSLKEKSSEQFRKILKHDINEAKKRGDELLKEVTEVNPRYFKSLRLPGEPPKYIESGAARRTNFEKKQWNKILNPEMWTKFYRETNQQQGIMGFNKGKVGDYIVDPKLRHALKDVLEVKVESMPREEGRNGSYYSKVLNPDLPYPVIILKNNLKPTELFSTLVHEATHALQELRLDKYGKSRLERRHYKPKDLQHYLENLNEVNARKFETWVTKPINKHRSALQKTRMARELWERQIYKKYYERE